MLVRYDWVEVRSVEETGGGGYNKSTLWWCGDDGDGDGGSALSR
jgi:hypothetical protein